MKDRKWEKMVIFESCNAYIAFAQESLKTNLEWLDLSANNITKHGLTLLATALTEGLAPTLTTLEIACNADMNAETTQEVAVFFTTLRQSRPTLDVRWHTQHQQ